jgi:hypothetical protein
MKRFQIAAVLAILVVPGAFAQETTKPIRHTWIASSCASWNCAAAALILANGDKYVIVLPTGETEWPWVILRRVEEGAIFIPEDEPFVCEVYETVDLAATRHQSMDGCHAPLLLNVPDGRAVVTSLTKCGTSKRRAVR